MTLLTGWTRLDSLVSLAIAVVIVAGTWNLLRDSVGMSLDAVPSGIKPEEVSDFLRQQPGVAAIHDLHIWPMSTTETALTCHFLMPGGHPGGEFLVQLAHQASIPRSRASVKGATDELAGPRTPRNSEKHPAAYCQ